MLSIILQHHHARHPSVKTCSYESSSPYPVAPYMLPQCDIGAVIVHFHSPFPISVLPMLMSYCDVSLVFRQSLSASSQSLQSSPHLSTTNPQLLARMIFSIPLSCRIIAANRSVLASLGKNRAEYGSNLSSTTLSLSFSLSTCRNTDSGSSLGTGEVSDCLFKGFQGNKAFVPLDKDSHEKGRNRKGIVLTGPGS